MAGDYLVQHWADRKIALLHDGEAYGAGLAEEARKRLEASGVRPAMVEQITPGLADYADVVAFETEAMSWATTPAPGTSGGTAATCRWSRRPAGNGLNRWRRDVRRSRSMAFRMSAPAAALMVIMAAASAEAEIVIGVAAPLTGHYAWSAEHVVQGTSLAIENINARGGVASLVKPFDPYWSMIIVTRSRRWPLRGG